jgi:hypothetical protein
MLWWPMDALAGAIDDWQPFYAVVAGVGATLVGLVYVGTSIHLGREPLDDRARLLATMSGTNLLYPVLASMILLMPVHPRTAGTALMVLAMFGLGASISITLAETRRPERQARQLIVYRFVLPLLASAVLAGGAVGFVLGQDWSVLAPAVFVFVMFAVGTDNAWDLLLSRYRKRSIIDVGPPPERM